jgi:hypothetical protein
VLNVRQLIAVVVLMAAGAGPGTGAAAGLETLIMPGKVTSAHAKLEQECSQCHDRADRGRQAALCMTCHKDVAADVRNHSGYHGRIAGIATAQCKACHSEHQGRDADIVKLSPVSFDHAHTDFALAGAHATAACASCHKAGKKYRDAPSACVDCHRADDPHAGKLGTSCANCHEPSNWTRVRFDHDKTKYPLRDAHRDVACAACHAGNRYAGTPSQCVSCHAPEDVHHGTRGPNCGSCHSTATWKTSKFDHAAAARFPLTGAHAKLECGACHKTPDLKAPLPRDCAGCHRADDAHATRFGTACEKCHGSSAWKPSTFDHSRDTHYVLPGNHAKLACHTCHTSVVAEQKLGQDCVSCHRTDDPHGGKLGQDCAHCHRVDSWRKGISFDHDRTSFPLVGLHGPVPCHACHVSPAFKGTARDCNSCHQRVDRHKGSLGKDCEQCHSPAGWNLWKFDHAKTAGGFALTGAHATATCASCHAQPPGVVKLRTDCASCHSKDDVHLGQFGRQCQRCHGTVTFRDARPH